MVGINTNIAAQNAQANLSAANSTVSKSVGRLSSGNRIINASDDVAGLAIGTKLQSNVTALKIGLLNANQAGTVLQIADGALKQVGDILSRQKALAVQANSGSLSNTERGFLNQEFTKLTSEIDRIVTNTNFNGITLLNGSISGDASVTVSSPVTTSTTTPAVPATDRSVTAATVNATETGVTFTATASPVASGSGTTGLTSAPTLNLSSFADDDVQGSSFIGAITVSDFVLENDTATTEPNSTRFQATINGTVYLSNRITASNVGGQIDSGTTITFTAQGGAGGSFSITTGSNSTAALNDSTNAAAFATALTNSVASVGVYQNRDITPAATASGALAGISSTAATIRSSNFNLSTDTLGTVGEFTVVAGSGSANSISVEINGVTYSDSDVNNSQGASNLLEAGESITLIGRNAGGDATGETLTIDLTSLTASIDLTDTGDAADLATALNAYFGVTITAATSGTPASTTTTGGFSTYGDIAGTKVTAVSVSAFDDSSFQGSFGTVSVAPGSFDENGSGAESVTLTTTLGDKTYTAGIVASGNGGNIAGQTLTFTATDGSGSAFSLTLAAETGGINTSTAADTYAAALTTALADVQIFQTRTINTVDVTAVANTVLEGLAADSVTLTSGSFDTENNTFGDIGQFTGVAGAGTENSLSVQVNGITFSATDLGGANDVLASTDGTITLIGRDEAGVDNGQRLTIDISDLTNSIDLTNQDGVDNLVSALNSYFGSGSSTGGLSFQVGSSVTDTIGVSIASVSTEEIYLDNDGTYTSLSIATADDASTAAEVLDNAINTIVSRRSDVGSLQSRFNFASANLQTSIANQDAARGSFLDADISAESTDFANAQVKLQASVSVLAQANQLPQNLLKLLQ